MSGSGYVKQGFLAIAYADVGDRDRAMDALEQAYKDHETTMVCLHLESWGSLRDHSRFVEPVPQVELGQFIVVGPDVWAHA